MNDLIHISDACRLLGTTSRTIRYYEQIGLIETVRENKEAPRRLDTENIEKLRRILFLRRLGLSLDDIRSVINGSISVAETVRDKRAGFLAEIAALKSHIRLLEEVMTVADNDGDIYAIEPCMPYSEKHIGNCGMADRLTDLLLERRFEEVTAHFTKLMKKRLPADILEMIWDDILKHCGNYIGRLGQFTEGNTVINELSFDKLGVLARFVFNDGQLGGLWFDYFKEGQL